MSAAIASRRRPSRIASAMYSSSSTTNTRMLRCYERHISPAYEKRDTWWQRPAALDGGMVYSETAARRATYRQPIRKRRAVGAVLAIAALAAALGLGLG